MSKRPPPFSDPKRPDAVIPYEAPKLTVNDIGYDIFGLLAVAFGMFRLIMKYKYVSWASLCFSIISIMNTKNSESDFKQGFTSVSFAVMGLALGYVQEYLVGSPSGTY